MRIPFFNMFMTSPFEGLQEHAEKVKECFYRDACYVEFPVAVRSMIQN